jgi:hypothetical protein
MRNVPVFLGAAAAAIAALGTTPVSLAFQPVAVSAGRRRGSSNSKWGRDQRRGPALVVGRPAPLFDGGQEDNKADKKKKENNVGATTTAKTTNAVETAAWYAVETFGKVFGKTNVGSDEEINTGPPLSLAETKRRLQRDNDQSYFLSGQVDAEIYDIDCVFADPFVSFTGRDRFITNLQNLGSFITQYDARSLQYNDDDNNTNIIAVTTKFMVKLELNLPWKPILAWPWGVRCVIDPTTYLIVRHEESVRFGAEEHVQPDRSGSIRNYLTKNNVALAGPFCCHHFAHPSFRMEPIIDIRMHLLLLSSSSSYFLWFTNSGILHLWK